MPGNGESVYQLLRVSRHGGIGKRIAGVEIGLRADDAVEFMVELDASAEEPLVRAEVAWRRMFEADASRFPVPPQQLPDQSHDDPERELCPLTRGLMGVAGDDRFANDHQPVAFLDRQRERTVEQGLIAHQDAQRLAQGRLVADQQPYRPEVGQQARFGHAQTETFVSRQGCGRVQQSPDALPRDHQVRLAQDAGTQAGVKEHPRRIQSGSQGDLAVVGEGRSADKRRHCRAK
ncbi:hypothetical protein D9M70_342480 [compost metagenome]